MKDPRVAKLIKALSKRFAGTTIFTRPMRDACAPGEVAVKVLNAPVDPPALVYDFARRVIDELWGDDPVPAFVSAVSPAQSAKYFERGLVKARRARTSPRRRPAARRKRVASR